MPSDTEVAFNAPSSTSRYLLSLRTSGLKAAVLINGFPAEAIGPGEILNNSRVNHWLVDGTNSIEIQLDLPPGMRTAPPGALIQVTLARDANPLYTYEGPEQQRQGDPSISYPRSIRAHFESGTRFGPWIWQQAPLLTERPELVSQASAAAVALYHAMSARDLDMVMAMLRPKIDEVSRAHGLDEERSRRGERQFFASLFSKEDWALLPLEPESTAVQLYAEGKVALITRRDGRQIIRSIPNANGFFYELPTYACEHDGSIAIIR